MSGLAEPGGGVWSVIRKYKLNSLFVRNLLLILIAITLPFAGILLIMNHHSRALMEDEIGAVHLRSLTRVSEMTDNIMLQTDRMATKLALLPEAQSFFKIPDYVRNFQVGVGNLGKSISSFIHVHDYIDSIHIYSELNRYIISNNNNVAVTSFRDDNWLEAYDRHPGDRAWTLVRKKYDRYPYLISIIRPAASIDPGMAGAVVVNLDIQRLGGLFDQTERTGMENIYIVGEDGRIIYHRDAALLLTELAEIPAMAGAVEAAQAGTRIVRIEGESHVLSVIPSAELPWTYISVMPMTQFEGQVQAMNRFYVLVLSGSILAILLAVTLIAVRTYVPLRRIMAIIDNPDEWESRQTGGRNGINDDELQYIAKGILDTTRSRRAVERELDHRIRLLNQAQTAALQAQINPHLLSNTLDSMQWLAIELTGGRNEVSRMVQSLSALMKASMRSDSHLIPVSQELDHAKRYIEIMEIRYPGRLVFETVIDPELHDYKIVQITLQPLIENAITHGIRPKRTGGTIRIEGVREGQDVVFRVKDDGIGIAPERLAELNTQLRLEYELVSDHIGIRNVNQRVKLLFGEAAGIVVESEPGEGTCILVRIPAIPG